jgi:CRP-like cAMP-binding protein
LLKKSFLTKNLSDTEIEKLAGAMIPREYKPSDLIIKYGDTGSEYFILSKGEVQVIVYKKDTHPEDAEIETKIQFTKVMQKGAGFGELSLLFNDKRSASIKAIDECTAYVLDGSVFKTVIIKSSLDKRSLKTGFLDKIKLFDQLDKN